MRKEFDQRFYRAILAGLVSYIPGMGSTLAARGGKNTLSARYCYAVWMRHLVKIASECKKLRIGKVAELGPGHSFGSGICALLTGATQYQALDIATTYNTELNIRILQELISLVTNRSPIPNEHEFPDLYPILEDYSFPSALLTDEWLEFCLHPDRIEAIEQDLRHYSRAGYQGMYVVHSEEFSGPFDLIFSQFVLEHVDNPQLSYQKQFMSLNMGGLISHSIDFWCHGKSGKWNGHWSYSKTIWKLMRGKRIYFLNRLPASPHLEMIKQNGFILLTENRIQDESGIQRSALVIPFTEIQDRDLHTRGLYVLFRKE